MLRNCLQAQYSSKRVSISYRLKTNSLIRMVATNTSLPLLSFDPLRHCINPRQLINTMTDENFLSEVCVYAVSKILNKST